MMQLQEKIKLTRQIMVIAGIFCAFTAILLLLNFWNLTRNNPLESLSMEALVERLASEPNNEELIQEIRNLDLLARKAHFTSRWQIRTGSLLLFSGAVIFSIALWFNRKYRTVIDKPDEKIGGEVLERLMTQKWLAVAGGSLIALSLIGSFLSTDYLKLYNTDRQVAGIDDLQLNEQVEEISISKPDDSRTEEVSDTYNMEQETEEVLTVSAVPQNEEIKTVSAAPPAYEDYKRQHNMFRGVFGHGVSFTKNIPVSWDVYAGRNIIWKKTLNKPGYNSPVIWDEKLFVAGGDKTSRVVYCFNKNTGELIWEKEASGIPGSPATPPNVTDDTGLSASSMAVDGRAIYAIFATGDIIAFDMEGKRLWARNLGVPDNHYGHSSSLLVWNNKVFVQYDTNKGGRLIALNSSDGKNIWDIRKANRISWASPILIKIENEYQIITSSEPYVAAFDPERGKQIWAVECMMGEVGPSPAFSDGIVFAVNEYAKLVAIEAGKDNAKIIWEEDEYMPEASSPVAYDGLLYLATSYGVIVCYDMRTGQKYWEHEANQGFYASPMIADGKVFVVDLGGIMYIFKTGKEKILLGEPELGEKIYATPAFGDGRIYLRGQNNLYCIGTN